MNPYSACTTIIVFERHYYSWAEKVARLPEFTEKVFNLERIAEETLSKIWFKLRQIRARISPQISFISGVIDLEDESNESKKTFYLLSLMLLISLIFLSPDKVLQAFSPTQVDIGILEKAQEMAKLIRKLMSSLV